MKIDIVFAEDLKPLMVAEKDDGTYAKITSVSRGPYVPGEDDNEEPEANTVLTGDGTLEEWDVDERDGVIVTFNGDPEPEWIPIGLSVTVIVDQ